MRDEHQTRRLSQEGSRIGNPLTNQSKLQTTMAFSIDSISNDTAIVTVGNNLDFRNASEFKTVSQDHVQRGIRNFILDFTGTESIDSTGLGSLFTLYRRLSDQKGRIFFASVSRPVHNTVQLTRAYKIFRLFATVDEAREAMVVNGAVH